jgi:flagellar motility protein MotE (MotC chaperone)
MLTDRSNPKKGLGLFVGGAIVASSISIFNPAGTMAAKGNEDDPVAVKSCAGEQEAGDLYARLRDRYIDLRTDTLAVKREKKVIERSRKALEKDLEHLEKVQKELEAKIEKWESRRSSERGERLTKLVGIVGEMNVKNAANLVAETEPELAVDLLVRLEAAKAGSILSLLPPERGARMVDAISARKGEN